MAEELPPVPENEPLPPPPEGQQAETPAPTAPVASTANEPPPPPPKPKSIGEKLEGVATDVKEAVKEGYDTAKGFVTKHIDEAVEAGKGETAAGLGESVARTIGAGGANAANDVTDLGTAAVNLGREALGAESTENPLKIDTDAHFGPPRNWMEGLGRAATSFGVEAALLPETKLGEGVIAVKGSAGAILKGARDFVLKSARVGALLDLGHNRDIEAAAVQSARNAPNDLAQRFVTGALQAHTHPEVIDYVRNYGRDFLSGATIEATLATGFAIKGAAEKWTEPFLQGVLDKATPIAKDVARILDIGGGRARVEASEAQNTKNLIAINNRQLMGQTLESNMGMADKQMRAEAARSVGNIAAAPGPMDREAPTQEHQPEERKLFQADSLLVPHPHEAGPVDLPDHGQAEVEVAQRNAAARNQDLQEKGPGAFKEGWSELVKGVRANAPLPFLNQIAEHHAIEVPMGVTKDAIHDYITKLGKMVKDEPVPEGGLSTKDLAENASRSLTPNILPRVALNRLAAAGIKDPQHYLAAAHLFTRAAVAQGTRTAQALDLAPDSPAAQAMVDKSYETLNHLFDLMRGNVPKAEGTVEPAAAGRQAETAAAQEQILKPLAPQVREDFARDLRIGNGNPAEAMEAVKIARMQDAQSQMPEGPEPTAEGGGFKKALLYYRVNNMIGGLGTIEKIGITNLFTMAKQPFVNMLGAPVHYLTGNSEAGKALFRSGYYLPAAYVHSFQDALRAGARAFRAGKPLADPLATLFPGGQMSQDLADLGPRNFIQTVIGAPGRFHSSISDFAKVMNYRGGIEAQAFGEAGARGESPENIVNARNQALSHAFEPNGAIKSATAPEKGDPFDMALEDARRNTLTRPLDGFLMGDWVNKGLEKYPLIHAAVSPFMRIGINAIGEGVAMTPGLAAIKQSVQDDMAAGGDRMAKAWGNQAVGATLITGGLMATLAGSKNFNLTGSPPDNIALRKQMEELGAKWRTLTIGPMEISLDRIPLAGPLVEIPKELYDGLAAHKARVEAQNEAWTAQGGNKWCYMANNPVFEWLRHVADTGSCLRGSSIEEGGKALGALSLSTTKKILDESWMKSATQLGDILTSGDSEENQSIFHRWVQDQVQTMVPFNSFWKSINSDSTHRETRGEINSVLQNLPGYSRTLEPDYNMFGQPMTGNPGFIEWKPDHTENPARGFKGPEAMREELLSMGAAFANIPSKTPGVNGAAPIDWKDRGWDDNHEKNTSPYARVHELLNSPMFNGRTATEVIRDLLSSEEYKKLPRQDPMQPNGPRWQAVAERMKELNDAAVEQMKSEKRYERFMLSTEGEKAVKQSNALLARQAADSARNSLFAGSKHILNSTPSPASDTLRILIKKAK